jgi:succinate-semialdehyde dehydrogenase/glutarate-semialdehyde dehydrogenase
LLSEEADPGVVIYRVAGAGEAIELADSSASGLGGVVCSKDPRRAQDVADRLDTGMV